MKRTYAVPTVTTSGSVVRETLGGAGSTSEAQNKKPFTAGRIGYNL